MFWSIVDRGIVARGIVVRGFVVRGISTKGICDSWRFDVFLIPLDGPSKILLYTNSLQLAVWKMPPGSIGYLLEF